MLASFLAELLKLKERPAVWVLLLLFVTIFILFSYLFIYVLVMIAPEDAASPPESPDPLLQGILPENVTYTILDPFDNSGAAIALILGALAIGSEYGWDTLKTVLTLPQSKPGFLSSKLLALLTVAGVFTTVVFAVGFLSSYAAASLEGAAVEWPATWRLVRAAGAGLLILAVFIALGFFLAVLFKGTALATGIGLIYVLFLENSFVGLQSQSDTLQRISQFLPTKNATDLTRSFSGEIPREVVSQLEIIEPSRAALVLCVYLVVFVGLSFLIFHIRDVD